MSLLGQSAADVDQPVKVDHRLPRPVEEYGDSHAILKDNIAEPSQVDGWGNGSLAALAGT